MTNPNLLYEMVFTSDNYPEIGERFYLIGHFESTYFFDGSFGLHFSYHSEYDTTSISSSIIDVPDLIKHSTLEEYGFIIGSPIWRSIDSDMVIETIPLKAKEIRFLLSRTISSEDGIFAYRKSTL